MKLSREVAAWRPGALSKNSRSSFSKSPPALVVTSSKSIGMAVVAVVEDETLESLLLKCSCKRRVNSKFFISFSMSSKKPTSMPMSFRSGKSGDFCCFNFKTQERGSRPDSLEVLGVFGASKALGVSAAVELAPPGVEAAKDGVGDGIIS
uniref:Uncharacterized protein n=1 Tax=Glossina austeni TaxID=7395 RepID=A0A1A9VMF2_GLOAU